MTRGIDIQKAEAAAKRAAYKATHGSPIERSGRVTSSVLNEAKYDESSRVLQLRFVSGRTYRYLDVPPNVFESLLKASSKGAFFSRYIRDRYRFQEL